MMLDDLPEVRQQQTSMRMNPNARRDKDTFSVLDYYHSKAAASGIGAQYSSSSSSDDIPSSSSSDSRYSRRGSRSPSPVRTSDDNEEDQPESIRRSSVATVRGITNTEASAMALHSVFAASGAAIRRRSSARATQNSDNRRHAIVELNSTPPSLPEQVSSSSDNSAPGQSLLNRNDSISSRRGRIPVS